MFSGRSTFTERKFARSVVSTPKASLTASSNILRSKSSVREVSSVGSSNFGIKVSFILSVSGARRVIWSPSFQPCSHQDGSDRAETPIRFHCFALFRRRMEVTIPGDCKNIRGNAKRSDEVTRIAIDGRELDLRRARDHVRHLLDLVAI